ncbi:Aste57867_3351 [Aphanomyces stellatus]|uniref:Aste57867_3351 protein n=1 Tax=Aphanomyces stellatus TaxID=120398 RepID=A0A485KEY7_9STRA|nr:hypothetical protein As57867_003341 [Aphanomyces stellatus]VFT80519.1 Aste57867_3351 [Aphanomyces stellatus]
MKRFYREQEKSERQALVRETELNRRLDTLVERRVAREGAAARDALSLSWREVCTGLLELTALSLAQQTALEAQIQRYRALATVMKALSCSTQTLLAHSTSRQLSKEWILKRLCHSRTLIFEQCAFCPFDEGHDFFDVDLRFLDDGSYVYTSRYQFVWGGGLSLATYVGHFYRNLCHLLAVNGLRPILETTVAEATERSTLHQVTTFGEGVNLLSGKFPDKDCLVLVAQQIHDDDL